ncbi:MAG: hypothetical protein NT139_02650 [Candidatus Woesearchaeota archaeon]|nr:hypothetical protein [Candidatus Woesearchaeota archaeon]
MKRGQSSGGPIATLILIIGGAFLVYLMLLPSEDRNQLTGFEDNTSSHTNCLNDCSSTYEDCKYDCDSSSCREDCLNEYRDCRDICGNDNNGEIVYRNLLSESPGVVFPFERNTTTQDFNSVRLFSNIKTENIFLSSRTTISKSLFKNDYKSFTFDLSDLENINKLSLFFNVISGKGSLIIQINGKEIYNGEVSSSSLPIEIPKSYLTAHNLLELSTSSYVLGSSSYDIKDLQLIKKYKVENKKESRYFVLSSTEKDNIQKATLKYFVNCMSLNKEGILKISLNNRVVSMYMIVCDAGEIDVEVDSSYFVSGRNTLTFEIDEGDYVIEDLQLDRKLEKSYYPKYYFSIQEDEFNDIKDNILNVKLKLDMINDKDVKRATFLINDNRAFMDTTKDKFEVDISDLIVEGENYIRIVPRDEFEITNLDVSLKEN